MRVNNSKMIAIFVGGLTLVANWISSFLLTPFCMKVLGIDEYGLYQLIFSVAQYVFILDFGITSVLSRYIAEYRERNDKKAEKNIASHMLIIVVTVSILIAIIGVLLSGQLGVLFPTLTESEIIISKKLFAFMLAQIILTLFSHYFEGIAMGYECFFVVKIIALIRIVLKTGLVFILLNCSANVMGIVYSDVIAMLVGCIFMSFYVFKKMHFKIAWQYFNKALTTEILLLSLSMLLRSVVTYVNNALDKTLLGIYCETADVTLYTIAMTFISIFSAAPSIIQGLYVPSATKLVVNNASSDELTDLVIKPGRFQFMFCGGFLGGYILFGKQFISLWTGSETTGAWAMALIIMVPMMIPLIQNVCLAILTAKNKRLVYSLILVGSTIINVPISIILIKRVGPIGAPIGTAISYLIGNGIAVNYYYFKVIRLNVIRMFKEILHGILPCILITVILSFSLTFLPLDNGFGFLIKCLFYVVVFAVLLFFFGINKSEKKLLCEKLLVIKEKTNAIRIRNKK